MNHVLFPRITKHDTRKTVMGGNLGGRDHDMRTLKVWEKKKGKLIFQTLEVKGIETLRVFRHFSGTLFPFLKVL